MSRIKTRWKVLAASLILIVLGCLWYTRPVDVHGLGLEYLTAIDVRISRAEPGVGDKDSQTWTVTPYYDYWQDVREEVEALHFRRPLGNLFRQYWAGYSFQDTLGTDDHTVFQLRDRTGREIMLQVGAARPCYTSPHTGKNLPVSLSGGEEEAQALAERLRGLLG